MPGRQTRALEALERESRVSTQQSKKKKRTSLFPSLYPVEADMTPADIEARSQAGRSLVLDRSYQLFSQCVNSEFGTAPNGTPLYSYAWLDAAVKENPQTDSAAEEELWAEARRLLKEKRDSLHRSYPYHLVWVPDSKPLSAIRDLEPGTLYAQQKGATVQYVTQPMQQVATLALQSPERWSRGDIKRRLLETALAKGDTPPEAHPRCQAWHAPNQPALSHWFARIKKERAPQRNQTLGRNQTLAARLKVINDEWARGIPTLNESVSQQAVRIRDLLALKGWDGTEGSIPSDVAIEVETLIRLAGQALRCDRQLVEHLLDSQRQRQNYAQKNTAQHPVGGWVFDSMTVMHQLLPRTSSVKPREAELPYIHHQGRLGQLKGRERIVLAGGYAAANALMMAGQQKQRLLFSNEALYYVFSEDRFIRSDSPDDIRWLQVRCASAEVAALRQRLPATQDQDPWRQAVISRLEQEDRDLLLDPRRAMRTSDQLDYVAHRLNFIRHFTSIAHRLPQTHAVELFERGLKILQRAESLARLGDADTAEAVLGAFYTQDSQGHERPNNIEGLAYRSIQETADLPAALIHTLWEAAEETLAPAEDLAASQIVAAKQSAVPTAPTLPWDRQAWNAKDAPFAAQIQAMLAADTPPQLRAACTAAYQAMGARPEAPDEADRATLFRYANSVEALKAIQLRRKASQATHPDMWQDVLEAETLFRCAEAALNERAQQSQTTLRGALAALKDGLKEAHQCAVEVALQHHLYPMSHQDIPEQLGLDTKSATIIEVIEEKKNSLIGFINLSGEAHSLQPALKALEDLSALAQTIERPYAFLEDEARPEETPRLAHWIDKERIEEALAEIRVTFFEAQSAVQQAAAEALASQWQPAVEGDASDQSAERSLLEQCARLGQRPRRLGHDDDEEPTETARATQTSSTPEPSALQPPEWLAAFKRLTARRDALKKEIKFIQALGSRDASPDEVKDAWAAIQRNRALSAEQGRASEELVQKEAEITAACDAFNPEQLSEFIPYRKDCLIQEMATQPAADQPAAKAANISNEADFERDVRNALPVELQEPATRLLERPATANSPLPPSVASALQDIKAASRLIAMASEAVPQATPAASPEAENNRVALTLDADSGYDSDSSYDVIMDPSVSEQQQYAETVDTTDEAEESNLSRLAALLQSCDDFIWRARLFLAENRKRDDSYIHSYGDRCTSDWIQLIQIVSAEFAVGRPTASDCEILQTLLQNSDAVLKLEDKSSNALTVLIEEQQASLEQTKVFSPALAVAIEVKLLSMGRQDRERTVWDSVRSDTNYPFSLLPRLYSNEQLERVQGMIADYNRERDAILLPHIVLRPPGGVPESILNNDAFKRARLFFHWVRAWPERRTIARFEAQYPSQLARSRAGFLPGERATRGSTAAAEGRKLRMEHHRLVLASTEPMRAALRLKHETAHDAQAMSAALCLDEYSDESQHPPGVEKALDYRKYRAAFNPFNAQTGNQPQNPLTPALEPALQAAQALNQLDTCFSQWEQALKDHIAADYQRQINALERERAQMGGWDRLWRKRSLYQERGRRLQHLQAIQADLKRSDFQLPEVEPLQQAHQTWVKAQQAVVVKQLAQPVSQAINKVFNEIQHAFSAPDPALQQRCVSAVWGALRGDFIPLLKMEGIEDQNGLLAGLLSAGLSGNHPSFAEAKSGFEAVQAEIRKHLISKLEQSAQTTGDLTQDLRKLGSNWKELCKNSRWPPAWIDFIKQDKAGAGARAKSVFEEAQAEIRKHLISKLEQSAQTTGDLTQDLRKLGSNWKELCKNSRWSQSLIDFVRQDDAMGGALKAVANLSFEHAKQAIRNNLISKFQESAKATDNPAEDLRTLGSNWEDLCNHPDWTQSLIDFIKQDDVADGLLEQVKAIHKAAIATADDALEFQGHVKEGQYTLAQRFREFCSGRPFSDLPTGFGLQWGSWDSDAEAFGIDPGQVSKPITDSGDNAEGVLPVQFVAALENRLKTEKGLELTPAELRLLFSQHSWEVTSRARRYIESKLPPGWMLLNSTFEPCVFRAEGRLYQSVSCANLRCLSPQGALHSLSGTCSLVFSLAALEEPTLVVRWGSHPALTDWLSGHRLKTQQAVEDLGKKARSPDATSIIPPPRTLLPADATNARSQDETDLLAHVDTIAHPDTPFSEAQQAYRESLTIINQSQCSGTAKFKTKVMLEFIWKTTPRSASAQRQELLKRFGAPNAQDPARYARYANDLLRQLRKNEPPQWQHQAPRAERVEREKVLARMEDEVVSERGGVKKDTQDALEEQQTINRVDATSNNTVDGQSTRVLPPYAPPAKDLASLSVCSTTKPLEETASTVSSVSPGFHAS